MKKVIFKEKSNDEIVFADDIYHLWDMNYSVGVIYDDIKHIVAQDSETLEYKKVSFNDFTINDLGPDDEYFAFNSDDELLEWLKVSQ